VGEPAAATVRRILERGFANCEDEGSLITTVEAFGIDPANPYGWASVKEATLKPMLSVLRGVSMA
jgi:hypothetical protein